MGLFSKVIKTIKKVAKPLGGLALAGPAGLLLGSALNSKQKAPSNDNSEQLALLQAQQTAAQNALADLSLTNTPEIVAGGTADILLGNTTKRKKNTSAQSISSSLGLS